jgi:hypothetical protein
MNEEELKEKYLSWLDSVKIRRIAYEQARDNLKASQEDLRISKKIFNRTYKDWKQARVEVERSKRKWKTYPYKLRQWAKQNWGKVFDMMEGKNE